MSRDVIMVGSTMRILMLYRGEYSQWHERFLNYLEEKTNGEAMIHSITHGEQPLLVVAQVSLAGTTPNAPPTLKDPKFWTAEEKKDRKIDLLEDAWDASLHVPLDEIKVDKTLRFVEEPVENSDREVKRFLTSLLDDGRGSGSWMFLFVWSGYAAMRTLCGQAKLLAVRYLVRVSWNSKCNFELTWVWEDYLKDKYPRLIVFVLVFVEVAKQSVSVTVSLLWIVDSERDRLIVVHFVSMFVIIERERLNVD
ncbi:hypothetical protein Tco_0421735 [Tanacetum coccineum]